MQSSSDSTKVSKDIDDQPDERKKSLVDTSGVPIFNSAKGRQHSYGSCDEAPDEHIARDDTSVVHKKRHQIGSEVLDFGESPAAWPNAITQRISKRTSQRAVSSFLPGGDAPSTPLSTGKRGFFRSLGSGARHNNSESLPPTSMGLVRGLSKRSTASKRGKTVLSLFGLDGSIAETHAVSGMELGVLTNRVGRPRANADASFQISPGSDSKSQLCACPKSSLELGAVRSRIVSCSRYLDEISRISANGAFMATSSNPSTESTIAADPSWVAGGQSKAQNLGNQSASLPVQEENPWQTCDLIKVDSKTTLKDLNMNTELTREVQPSMHVGLGSGEVADAAATATTPKDDCREDTHAMTVVQQSLSTAKPIASPSPKRTASLDSIKLKSTAKSRAQSRDRKPFIVPGLADIGPVAEASTLVWAASQAKRSVSKQRSQGKGLKKKDGGVLMIDEK